MLQSQPRLTEDTARDLTPVELVLFSPSYGDRKITIHAKPPYETGNVRMIVEIVGIVPGVKIRGEVLEPNLRKLATHLNAACLITDAWQEGR